MQLCSSFDSYVREDRGGPLFSPGLLYIHIDVTVPLTELLFLDNLPPLPTTTHSITDTVIPTTVNPPVTQESPEQVLKNVFKTFDSPGTQNVSFKLRHNMF